MKRLNFNIKDKKMFYMVLGVLMVSVLTISVAYAALSTVLEISGNAQVNATNWDIHLENPVVKSGSSTTDVPTITGGNSLTFTTTLNMPGDFYEFTVDVVNGGSIDAMIDSVVKTPELTAAQAKYLTYEITYQNGESIISKQNLAAGSTTPLKVRLAYRTDLSTSDLPTTPDTLNLSIILNYIQSDGTGSDVTNNGVQLVTANGSLDAIGTVVTIGDQQFYTIGTEGDNVKLFSMMNITLDENPVQSASSGTTVFSSANFNSYNGSIVEGYVNNYKTVIEEFGVRVEEARLITFDELDDSNTFRCYIFEACSNKYPWIYSTSYWTGSGNGTANVMIIKDNGEFNHDHPYNSDYGVRPVIVISKDYFN